MGSLSGRRRAAVTVQAFKAVEQPAQFALWIAAARELSATSYGIVTLLVSLQALYMAVAAFGFDETLQRRLARKGYATETRPLDIAFRARGVIVGVTLATTGVAVGVTAQASPGLTSTVALVGVGAALALVATLFQQIALGVYDVSRTALASLISWLLPLGLVAGGLVHTTAGYMGALAGGNLLQVFVSIAWFGRAKARLARPKVFWRGRPALLEAPVAHGSLVVYNVTNQVLARHGDVFVAGLVGLSARSIGTYGLAFQITAAGNQFLLLGIGALGLTRLSEDQHEPGLVKVQWRRLTKVAATLALGPECLIVLLAPDLVHLTVGTKYPGFVTLLRILAAAQWAGRLAGGGTNIGALIALGRMRYAAQSALWGAALNLVLDAVLCATIGAPGLAIGTGTALVVVGLANIRYLAQSFHAGARQTRPSAWRDLLRTPMAELPTRYLGQLTVVFAACQFVSLTQARLFDRIAALVLSALWILLCLRELTSR